jgi:hypothetical protein
MLEAQENAIEKKLQENFQAILSKLNSNAESPIRKKVTLTTTPDQPTHPSPQQDSIMTEAEAEQPSTKSTPTIHNPYSKIHQQRRSANSALPPMTP